MTIRFDDIEEAIVPNFKGGDKEIGMRVYDDGSKKIMRLRLQPGASIGLHTHTDNCEIIYPVSGHGIAICDGVAEEVVPGTAHYCPKGSAHTLRNDGDTDLVLNAVVG